MKSNKITFEMLDSYVKSKLDEKLDVRLVASFDDIPKFKTESDADNYIIMSDDITTNSLGETINRKGYIYSAYKTGDTYTFTGIQDKIEFYPYDLLNNNPFAMKNHTHKPNQTDGIKWTDIQNTPDEYMPESHMHDWDDLYNKPETFPPSEHTHDDIVAVSTWNTIVNKPTSFPPSEHTHEFSDILNDPYENHTHEFSEILNDPYKNHTHSFNEITNYPYDGMKNKFYNPSFRIYQRLMSNSAYLSNPNKALFPFSIKKDTEKKMYFDRWFFQLTSWYVETLTFNNFDVGFKASILYNSSTPTASSNLGEFIMEQKLHVKDIGYHDFKKNQTIPLVLTLGSNLGSEECIFDKVKVYQNDELIGEIDKDNNTLYTSYTVTDENQLEYINFKFIFSFVLDMVNNPDRNNFNLEIYYAKLEVGTHPTPFVLDPYEDELDACKKFYQMGWIPSVPVASTYRKFIDIPIIGYRKMNSKPTVKAINGLYLFNVSDETQSITIATSNNTLASEMFILTDTYGLLTIGNYGKVTSLNIPVKQFYIPSGSAVKENLLNRKPVMALEAEYE